MALIYSPGTKLGQYQGSSVTNGGRGIQKNYTLKMSTMSQQLMPQTHSHTLTDDDVISCRLLAKQLRCFHTCGWRRPFYLTYSAAQPNTEICQIFQSNFSKIRSSRQQSPSVRHIYSNRKRKPLLKITETFAFECSQMLVHYVDTTGSLIRSTSTS